MMVADTLFVEAGIIVPDYCDTVPQAVGKGSHV